MKFHFITSDPKILNGRAIIKGSRISVEIILEWLSTGGTIETIYHEFSHLPKGSIEDAIKFAAQFSQKEILRRQNHFLSAIL